MASLMDLTGEERIWFEAERARLGITADEMLRRVVDFARAAPRSFAAESVLVTSLPEAEPEAAPHSTD